MGHFLSAVATSANRDRHGKPTTGIGVVLIVEDEALIRMNAVQMVEDAGYTALEASSADDAVEILNRRLDVRAVFTDVNMAGSTCGLMLAHAIHRRWPPIHLIVTSGSPAGLELPDGAHFVCKPYENGRIVALLHELFDGH
jgi:CheY-like chemotaxis protein